MSFTAQTHATVRVAGPFPYRLFAADLGEGRLEVRLTAGDLLVHTRTGITAQRVRETLRQTRPFVGTLPYVLVPRTGQATAPPVLGIAGLVVHLAPATRCVASRMPAIPGQGRPTHIRVDVGPLTWEICDGAAWQTLLQAWTRVTSMFAALDGDDAPSVDADC